MIRQSLLGTAPRVLACQRSQRRLPEAQAPTPVLQLGPTKVAVQEQRGPA